MTPRMLTLAAAQQAAFKRTMLQKHDLIGDVLEGTLTLLVKGKPVASPAP